MRPFVVLVTLIITGVAGCGTIPGNLLLITTASQMGSNHRADRCYNLKESQSFKKQSKNAQNRDLAKAACPTG